MLRVLFWMLTILLWLDVFVTAAAYGSEVTRKPLSVALILTSAMVLTEPKIYTWLK